MLTQKIKRYINSLKLCFENHYSSCVFFCYVIVQVPIIRHIYIGALGLINLPFNSVQNIIIFKRGEKNKSHSIVYNNINIKIVNVVTTINYYGLRAI